MTTGSGLPPAASCTAGRRPIETMPGRVPGGGALAAAVVCTGVFPVNRKDAGCSDGLLPGGAGNVLRCGHCWRIGLLAG